MKRLAIAVAVILGCAVAGWSQAYYEASGQTQVFTLTAGAKSGPAAIRGGSVMRTGKKSGINITVTRGGIVIRLPAMHQGSVDISLYDITGRQVYRQCGTIGISLRLETQTFAPGIYNVLVHVNGQNFTRRVVLNGREE